MSVPGVRREKAALSSGCKSHPATAPAGSNRSSHGGNKVAEASGCVSKSPWGCRARGPASKGGDQTDPRRGLLEQFHVFADQLRGEGGQPVTLPPGRARLVTSPSATGFPTAPKTMGMVVVAWRRGRRVNPGAHDGIDLERNQFGRESGEPLRLPFRPAIFDPNVASRCDRVHAVLD